MRCHEVQEHIIERLSRDKDEVLNTDALHHLHECPHCQAWHKQAGSVFVLLQENARMEPRSHVWEAIQEQIVHDSMRHIPLRDTLAAFFSSLKIRVALAGVACALILVAVIPFITQTSRDIHVIYDSDLLMLVADTEDQDILKEASFQTAIEEVFL